MRIPDWTPERKPQPADLVDAIRARRGGALINLDRALLWSEPLARGWNVYLKAVRSELPTSWKLRELGICTVAMLTGAEYEYHHHAPDFLKAGGTQDELDALNRHVKADPRSLPADPALGSRFEIELAPRDTAVIIHYRTTDGAQAMQWLEPTQTAGGKQPFSRLAVPSTVPVSGAPA